MAVLTQMYEETLDKPFLFPLIGSLDAVEEEQDRIGSKLAEILCELNGQIEVSGLDIFDTLEANMGAEEPEPAQVNSCRTGQVVVSKIVVVESRGVDLGTSCVQDIGALPLLARRMRLVGR
jgi:hypothetical protein